MKQIIAIALGGSTGAVARYWVANGIYDWLGRDFPHGTLFVNVSGSFLMGLLTEFLLQRFPLAVEYRAAILVGFLGAYTTFSTFAIETLYLFEEGNAAKAGLNIFLSVVLCLAAVWIGLIFGRLLFPGDLYPWLGHGYPYYSVSLGLVLLFLLALITEGFGQMLALQPLYRGMALISVLGIVTIGSSLWAVYRLSEIRLEFHGFLGIFGLNALCGVAVVWLGALAGDWLWQVIKSRWYGFT